MKLGDVPGEDGIKRSSFTLSLVPDNLIGTNAACPADKTVQVLGQTITLFNMAEVCGLLAAYLRPMAILLASLSALFIVTGAGARVSES